MYSIYMGYGDSVGKRRNDSEREEEVRRDRGMNVMFIHVIIVREKMCIQ